MNLLQHPSNYLSTSDTELIRSYALQAEQKGELTSEQLQLIYDRDWFRVMVPKYLGGSEWTLIEVMQLCEAAAWADGSFGWALNLGAGANLFSAYLTEKLSTPLFSNNEICIAGSDTPSGTAERAGNEFIINGKWKYATGAPHAKYFSFNCVIVENGHPIKNDHGENIIRSFILSRESVIITDPWNSYGLIATASHNFKVENIHLHKDFSFDLSKPAHATGILFRFPFLQLAESLLCVTICGMAIHFIDLVERLIKNKLGANPLKKNQLLIQQTSVEQSKEIINKSREKVYHLVQNAWQELSAGRNLSTELLTNISHAARELGLNSRIVSEKLYPFAGMSAIIPTGEINRTWRDIHTASQHVLLQ